MKNIEVLYTADDLRNRLAGMWKTDLFKKEVADPNSFISKVIERAAQYPTFMYDISDVPEHAKAENEKLEWPHFYAWMGGVAKRTYANPAINDLALLHELFHKGCMSYGEDFSFEAWRRKQFDNELEASVTSELEIYFRHPEFRDLSFKQEIFADRFLRDPEFMQRWNNDPVRTREFIREKRRDAMHQPDPNDPVQYWIHNFAKQNEAWALTWSHRYNQVETAMCQLHRAIDSGEDPKAAMDQYMAWLTSPAITKGTDVPFVDEANAFYHTYMLNKRYYQEAIAAGQLTQQDKPEIDILDTVKKAYPDATPDAIASALRDPAFLKAAVPLPHYSSLDHAQLHVVKTSTIGAFTVAYANDTSATANRKDPLVVVIRRGDTGPNGEARFGMLGGYTELGSNKTAGESLEEGAKREMAEEACDDQGEAILSPDASRLDLLHAKIDYRKASLPVTAHGYALALTTQELNTVKRHIDRLANDPGYREASKAATKGEVADMRLMKLSEVLAMPRDSFTHPHEYDAVEQLSQKLEKQASRQR